MPKWPKEIRMLGATYSVEVRKEVLLDGEPHSGLTDEEGQKILVEKSTDKPLMWSTLIHEMGHMWLRESGLVGNMSDDMEEMIVISLEKHFAPALLEMIGKGHITSMKTSKPASKRRG